MVFMNYVLRIPSCIVCGGFDGLGMDPSAFCLQTNEVSILTVSLIQLLKTWPCDVMAEI